MPDLPHRVAAVKGIIAGLKRLTNPFHYMLACFLLGVLAAISTIFMIVYVLAFAFAPFMLLYLTWVHI